MSETGASATRITPGNALRPEDVAASADRPPARVAEYAVGLGDDALILAQRLGWWISRAPELEEDVALGNIALDLLGHARSFLSYAGHADGRTEDDLAYFRDEPDFRCVHLVEQPNGDFARTIARQLLVSCYQYELYLRLSTSTDPTLAAIAAKAVREVDYHRDHSIQWVLRLALGTDESRRRMDAGLALTWPYAAELFMDTDLTEALEREHPGVGVRPSLLREPFEEALLPVVSEAGLTLPDVASVAGEGRNGRHSEHLGYILSELQVLARRHPGAQW